MQNKRTIAGVIALGAAASLALAGCSSDSGSAEGGDKGTVKLGYLPAWTDGLSTAYLLEDQLGKMGYTVEMDELTEAGVLYAGLAGGDFDIYPSAWPEVTHASYMEQYSNDIEDLGAYYDGAVLTMAVPDYVDIDSIEDLAGDAKRFDGQIIGIEPGAGLTKQTQEVAMPEYGLDSDYELVTSSTATMLATLQDKIKSQEDVVVTLWRPFWANDAFPLKDLADPKGAMGDPESLHFLAKQGFAEDMPEVADYIAKIKLDDEAYGALESLVTGDEYKNDPQAAVDAWLDEYGDAYPGLIAS